MFTFLIVFSFSRLTMTDALLCAKGCAVKEWSLHSDKERSVVADVDDAEAVQIDIRCKAICCQRSKTDPVSFPFPAAPRCSNTKPRVCILYICNPVA